MAFASWKLWMAVFTQVHLLTHKSKLRHVVKQLTWPALKENCGGFSRAFLRQIFLYALQWISYFLCVFGRCVQEHDARIRGVAKSFTMDWSLSCPCSQTVMTWTFKFPSRYFVIIWASLSWWDLPRCSVSRHMTLVAALTTNNHNEDTFSPTGLIISVMWLYQMWREGISFSKSPEAILMLYANFGIFSNDALHRLADIQIISTEVHWGCNL